MKANSRPKHFTKRFYVRLRSVHERSVTANYDATRRDNQAYFDGCGSDLIELCLEIGPQRSTR
jgi:hypothetical protein